jgi:hypothetical protein
MTAEQPSEETKNFSREFSKALQGEDELGVIIRAHIYIESELDKYLAKSLTDYGQLGRLDYGMKVRLALASGLRRDLKAPLNALEGLRNKFAHQLGMTLTAADVDNFYNTFGKTERNSVDQSLAVLSGQKQIVSHARLDPKSRMVVYVLALWGAMLSAQNPWEPQSLFE